MKKYENPFDDVETFDAINVEQQAAYIQEKKQVEQQSRDWFNARIGKFTSSRMPDLMSRGRGELFGVKAINYVQEIFIERTLSEEGLEIYIDQQMSREYVQTKWGNKYEPIAKKEIEKVLGLSIKDCTFVESNMSFFGGSADFQINGTPGEIKCPYNVMIHQHNLELMQTGIDRSHTYYAQIQAHIMNFHAEKCLFCSYDPRRDEKSKLAIIEVYRDDEFIAEMIERLYLANRAVEQNIMNGIPVAVTLNGKK